MSLPVAGSGEMAGTVAELPKGNRITDFIGLGMVAKTLPS